MLAVKTVAVTALLLLFGCGSGDISVKSDVGEEYLVKKTSVTANIFETEQTIQTVEEMIGEFQDAFEDLISTCMRDGISNRSECYEILTPAFVEPIEEMKETVKTLKSVPVTTVVRFRTVDTDVNGDKTASDYWNVVCVPDGTNEERNKWGEVLVETMEKGVPDTVWKTNLFADGSVAASVRKKVCEKYGQSS